jgi:hypothetical protein
MRLSGCNGETFHAAKKKWYPSHAPSMKSALRVVSRAETAAGRRSVTAMVARLRSPEFHSFNYAKWVTCQQSAIAYAFCETCKYGYAGESFMECRAGLHNHWMTDGNTSCWDVLESFWVQEDNMRTEAQLGQSNQQIAVGS